MKISQFLHKRLKTLYLDDNARGLPPDVVDKLRATLTFLQDMQNLETLRVFSALESAPAHQRPQGVWSLHVKRNWRLTFRIEDDEIVDVNYEDYH